METASAVALRLRACETWCRNQVLMSCCVSHSGSIVASRDKVVHCNLLRREGKSAKNFADRTYVNVGIHFFRANSINMVSTTWFSTKFLCLPLVNPERVDVLSMLTEIGVHFG